MSAETTEEAPSPAAAAEEAAPTEEKPAAAPAEGKKNFRKRDETPIEELFDLSKPIPRAEKPDKEQHDKDLQELTTTIDTLKEERRQVQEKIDAAMSDPEAKSGLKDVRAQFNEVRSQKNALIEEKKGMRAQLDSFKTTADKIAKDRKDARSNMKFNTIGEIEDRIRELRRMQETTSMSLNEEKRLLKEVDSLQASKKYVEDLKEKNAAMDDVEAQRKVIWDQIRAKDKEIDALSKQLDDYMATIKKFNEEDNKKREAIQELFKQRDEYKKQIGEKLKQKDNLRDTFREKNNAWFNFQRAVRAQKKMQYEEEKRKREEEHAAYLAKIEAEEAKKIPYEEEQALCEFLADYLERTYLKKKDEKKEKKSDVVQVKDDPFAGFKPVGKKAGEEEEFFGKGKGKKKRNRTSKKQDSLTAAPFTLSVDTFEQFGLLSLNPPVSIDQVEASVKELREKKEWYKQQERGSVPTAAEIRKANEKAAKSRQPNGGGQGPSASKGKGFSLENEDFIPLGAGGAASSVNSSWGQKPAAEPAVDEPAPAEPAAEGEAA